MNAKIDVAVAGCGMIGQFHLEVLKHIPACRLLGVWDANRSLASSIASKHNVGSFNSFDELLSNPEVDLVTICLPSSLHAKYGIRAADAGKHVIVEKPIDVSMEAAQQLIDACNDANVYLAVIFQNRFSPSALKIKEALDKNVLGRLIYGEAAIKWYRSKDYYLSRHHRGTLQHDGGGALINQGIHTIDLLLWYMGRPAFLRSLTKTALHPIEFEDLAIAVVEFDSGALGTIISSTAMKPGYPEKIELYGEKGSIVLEAGRIVRWQIDNMDETPHLDIVRIGSASSDPEGITMDNHIAQVRAIVAAILNGQQPPVCGVEALESLQTILDIYKLSKT